MAKTDTKGLSTDMPLSLVETVDQLSASLEPLPAQVVKKALAEGITSEYKRSLLTREALEDVEAGRVINQQCVMTWVESLSTNQPIVAPS